MAVRVVAGRYRVLARLGRGGMGAVYEAEHVGTGGKVALKLLATPELVENPEVLLRFEREARAAARMTSQHIVRVFDVGVDEESGSPFLAMEMLKGEDLSAALKRLGALPVDVALCILAQVCRGLATAHALGIVHRDVKPANVFLTASDSDEVVVKVLDFGIAKIRIEAAHDASEASALTRTGSVLGSPQYMSPEQAHGLKDLGATSDVWSLGVLLYKMLTGVTPHHYVHELGRLIVAITSRKPRDVRELAPWVPEPVTRILLRALSLKPAERYADAAAMLEDLRPLLPHGSALESSQLVSLGPVERTTLDEKLNVTIVDPDKTVTPDGDEAKTHSALAQSNEAGTGQRKAWPFVLAFAVLALGGVAFLGFSKVPLRETPAVQSSDATPTPANSEPPPVASPAPAVIVAPKTQATGASDAGASPPRRGPTQPVKAATAATAPPPAASAPTEVGARRKFE